MTEAEIEKRAREYAKLWKKHGLRPDRMSTSSSFGGRACLLTVIGVENKTDYATESNKLRGAILEAGFMRRTEPCAIGGCTTCDRGIKPNSVYYKIGKRVAELVGL
jgi:hypothetical protein